MKNKNERKLFVFWNENFSWKEINRKNDHLNEA